MEAFRAIEAYWMFLELLEQPRNNAFKELTFVHPQEDPRHLMGGASTRQIIPSSSCIFHSFYLFSQCIVCIVKLRMTHNQYNAITTN